MEPAAPVAEGDEVFGFLPYSGSNKLGAFAEYTVSTASGLTRKAAGVSHAVAAAAATLVLSHSAEGDDVRQLMAKGLVEQGRIVQQDRRQHNGPTG